MRKPDCELPDAEDDDEDDTELENCPRCSYAACNCLMCMTCHKMRAGRDVCYIEADGESFGCRQCCDCCTCDHNKKPG